MGIKRIAYFLTATLALLFFTFAAQGEGRPFITRWKGVTRQGLTIPVVGTNYKLVIKKADGTVLHTEASLTVSEIKNSYSFSVPEEGEYIAEVGPEGVEYTQSLAYIDLWNGGELLEVVSWGDVAWTTMEGAFFLCKKMTLNPNAGIPNLQKVKSMRSMFNGCNAFNTNIEDWDVANVENMRFVFRDCSLFNQPLNKWGKKLSKVTNLYGMFYECPVFNMPLDQWDVSSVIDMESMFYNCLAFNQPLNSWDVQNVTNMKNMFCYCSAFNQPLNNWNVQNVTNMQAMFYECSAFNQPLDAWGDKVQNVEDMVGMFTRATSFDQPLGNWQLRKCKVLSIDFTKLSTENYRESLAGWAAQPNIVKNMTLDAEALIYMQDAEPFRKKLTDENGSNWSFYGDLTPSTQFKGNRPFITRWVADAGETLKIGFTGVNLDITWYAFGSTNKNKMNVKQAHCALPVEITVPTAGEYIVEVAPQGLVSIRTHHELWKKIFTSHKRLLEIVQWGDVVWKSMCEAFGECYHVTIGARAGKPDLSEVTDCSYMFCHCDELNQSMNDWDVSGVEDMEAMFDGCLILNQPFDKWDVRKVEDMNGMFSNCRQLNQDFSSWKLLNCKRLGFGISGISTANYDKMLKAWAASTDTPKKFSLDAREMFFSKDAEEARNKLISEKEWKFKGDRMRDEAFAFENFQNFVYEGETIDLKLIAAPDLPNKGIEFHFNEEGLHNLVVTLVGENTVRVKGLKETKFSWESGWIYVTRIIETSPRKTKFASAAVKVRKRHKVENVIVPDLLVSVEQYKLADFYVFPGNALNKVVQWRIEGDGEVAEVDTDGKVKGKKEGKCTLVATSSDGAEGRATVTVKPKEVTPPTPPDKPDAAIHDALFASVVISPNPFDTQLRISNGDVRGKYTLLNTLGVEVTSGVLEAAETRINTTSLPAGIYLLRLTAENGAAKTFTVVKN